MAKRRILYGLILLAAVILYIFLADYLSYYVLLFFLCLPACSFFTALLNGRRCVLKLSVPVSPVRKGEAIDLSLQSQGRFLFYRPALSCCLSVLHEKTGEMQLLHQTFSAAIRGTVLSASLSTDYCGAVRVEIKKARLCDPLGLFSFPIAVSGSPDPVFVLPEIQLLPGAEANEVRMLVDSDIFSKKKPGDDPAEVFDIREYREGDRLSRLHIKLSAKFDQPMVKEMSLSIPVDTLLLLEANGSPSENDRLFDLAASLSFSLLTDQKGHRLCWYDPDKEAAEEAVLFQEEDFSEALFTWLAAGKPGTGTPALEWLTETSSSRQYAQIYYLCSQPPAAALELLRQCFPLGHIMIFSAGTNTAALFSIADALIIELAEIPLGKEV